MGLIKFKELVAEVGRLRGRTAVSFHSLADLDAVASATILKNLLEALKGRGAEDETVIRAVDRENAQAKKVLRGLGFAQPEAFSATELQDLNYFDNIIFVDVSSPEMLDYLGERMLRFGGKVYAIDHHTHTKMLHGQIYIEDEKGSACEIILEITKALGYRLSKNEAMLLAAGIASDTGNLASANTNAMAALSGLLLQAQAGMREINSLLEVPAHPEEKLESLRALKSAKVERVNDVVLACVEVSAYEARCACALVSSGADFAVAYNQKSGKLSALKGRHPSLNGLQVGRLLKEVALHFRGTGGGHESVGGASVEKEVAGNAANECMKIARHAANLAAPKKAKGRKE